LPGHAPAYGSGDSAAAMLLVPGAVAAGFARNLTGRRVFQAVQGMASLGRAASFGAAGNRRVSLHEAEGVI